MTSSYVSLMDEQSADESDSLQTKRGSAKGRKGGRLGGGQLGCDYVWWDMWKNVRGRDCEGGSGDRIHGRGGGQAGRGERVGRSWPLSCSGWLRHLPRFPGRHLLHEWPTLTQAQFLQVAERLQRQQFTSFARRLEEVLTEDIFGCSK